MKDKNYLDDFDDSTPKNLQFENELLKLKLSAEFGAMHSSFRIPLEIENAFLKNIIAVEQALAQQKMIRLFDKVGRPSFKNADDLTEEELEEEFIRLDSLLNDHAIFLSFSEKCTSLEKYLFLTTELFDHQVADLDLPNLTLYFRYEDFHGDEEFE